MPDTSFRQYAAESLKRRAQTPSVSQMFDKYQQQAAENNNTSVSSFDKQISDLDAQHEATRQKQDAITRATSDIYQAEADRHQTDPKRERWSRIASAATDAINGISGIIGMSNGAYSMPVTSSSSPTHKHYESEKDKRKEALLKHYQNQHSQYEADLKHIEARRNQLLKERQQALNQQRYDDSLLLRQQQQANKDLLTAPRLREAEARALRAEQNAKDQQAINAATIAAKNRSNQPKQKKYFLNKLPSFKDKIAK